MSLLCGKNESKRGKRDKSLAYGEQPADEQASSTSELSEQDINRLHSHAKAIGKYATKIKDIKKNPKKRVYEDPYKACTDEATGVLKVLKRDVPDQSALDNAKRERDDARRDFSDQQRRADDLDAELRKADTTLRKRDRELVDTNRAADKLKIENERLRKDMDQAISEPRSPTISASVVPCQKCSLYRKQIEDIQQTAVTSPTARSPPGQDEEKRKLRINLENAIRDAERERNDKNTALSRLSNENENLQQNNEELRRQNEKLKASKSDNVDGQKDANEAQLALTRLDGELQRTRADKDTLQKTIDELRRQNDKLKSSVPIPIPDTGYQIDQLQQELKRKAEEVQRLRLETQSVEVIRRENEQMRSAPPPQMPDALKQVENLQNELKRKDEEIFKLQENMVASRGLRDELAHAQRLLQASEKNKENLEKEKDSLLTRLSAVASSRLRDNNPAITDLSDPNRPLKLGEKMSELYDNEWTNAMEEMENLKIEEQDGLTILLHILQETYNVCIETADKQLAEIQTVMVLPPTGIIPKESDAAEALSQEAELRQGGYRPVDRHSVHAASWIHKGPMPFGTHVHKPQADAPTSPTSPSAPLQKSTSRIPLPKGKTIEPKHSHIPVLRSPSSADQNGESTPQQGDKVNSTAPKPPAELLKQTKDFRKIEAVANEAITIVNKIVKKRLEDRGDWDSHTLEACKEYIMKCVELCWLMRIQDPPVVLLFNTKEGDSFNGDIWRSYTKSGPTVDYAVWPAMYLTEGGAMLSKGVAQGRK